MNANEFFLENTGTENYYKYSFGLLITDGVKSLSEKFECFWLLDIISSYYPQLRKEEFQVWKLERNEGSTKATVICTDGNDMRLVKQEISFTDLKATSVEIWLQFNVILLPSEY